MNRAALWIVVFILPVSPRKLLFQIQILLLLSFCFSLFCFVFREEVIYCFYWKGATVVHHFSLEILQTRLIVNNWGHTFIGSMFLRLGQYMGNKTIVTCYACPLDQHGPGHSVAGPAVPGWLLFTLPVGMKNEVLPSSIDGIFPYPLGSLWRIVLPFCFLFSSRWFFFSKAAQHEPTLWMSSFLESSSVLQITAFSPPRYSPCIFLSYPIS